MTYTCASLFSGGGGFDIGAKAAGFTPVCASEYDPTIAAVYAENLGDHIRVGDILDENPATWPKVDLLHASPPCPNFSTAKTNAAETPHDFALATKVAEFIAVLKPRWFTLENVRAYRKSASFAIICKALAENGYWYDAPILNSADFGVPQTRQRLFLRAVRGGMVPPLQPPTRWIGWYEAIADIIDTLPETEFAEWQLKRLPKSLADSTFFSNQVGTDDGEGGRKTELNRRDGASPGFTIAAHNRTTDAYRAVLFSRTELVTLQNGDMVGRTDSQPSRTIVASDGERPGSMARAFLVESKNANQQYGDGVRLESEPATTVITDHKFSHQPTAFIVDGKPLNYAGDLSITPTPTITSSQTRHPFRAWLSQGRIVKMTPRALARFQSFPDWYKLPASKILEVVTGDKFVEFHNENNGNVSTKLACRIIGNAVPPLLAEAACRSLLR